MFQSIVKKALSFRKDDRGVIAMLFAILILPLLTVVAVGVDLSEFLVMKQELQAAVDAAALNVGQSPTLSNSATATQAQAFISANYPNLSAIATLKSLTVTQSTSAVIVTANASMNTNFLQIIGYRTLGVTVSSQVSFAQNKMEVVLVLDNTGSMSQN